MVLLPNSLGKKVFTDGFSVCMHLKLKVSLHRYQAFREKLIPGRWNAQASVEALGAHQYEALLIVLRCSVSSG